MPDFAITEHDRQASDADAHRCVFFCEYVARNKTWKWSWCIAGDEHAQPAGNRAFSCLHECLQDAARHGFNDPHISIRYEPSFSLWAKLDDRSRDFIRALKQLISSGKSKERPVPERSRGASDANGWTFSGSPRATPNEFSAGQRPR